jgi:outer membrane protein TolC
LPALNTDALIDGGTDAPLGFGAAGSNPTGSGRTVDMRIQVSQKLFDVPSLRRFQSSAADAQAGIQTAKAATDGAARQGALAYLRVLRAEAQLAARVADSTLAAELLDIARQQLAAGTAIALDVTRAESQLASAVSQLITGRSERARSELELLHTLALPVNTRLAFADSLAQPSGADFAVNDEDAVRGALTRRGDVLSAAALAVAARRDIGAVKAERLPTVSLFGNLGSNSNGMLDQRSYGLSVSLPIFDGFGREARVAEGQAREREANAQWDDARLRTEVDVRSALLDLKAARERVAATAVQLRLAEQEVSQARERFRAGVAGNADVINASLTLNSARDLVVDALTAYHAARVELASAQGAATTLR